MFKVKTFNKISKEGLKLFDGENYEVSENAEKPDALILRSFKLNESLIGDEVKCIARAGAGVNNIPVDMCSENGVVVFNTPGANANAVKELVICSLFLASRDVPGALGFATSLKNSSDDISKSVESNKSRFKGPELYGKTLGVIGLGAIGLMVANVASSLGMNILGYDPYLLVDSAWKLSRKVKKAVSIDEVYKNSDYITMHVPLLDSTRGMIGTDTIAKMKKGVRILNFSRGGLVDEAAIIEAMESGMVEKYVTDFPSKRLLNCSKAVCIPHLGASTYESEINCAVMAVNQIADYLENGNIKNSVNFPYCTMERTSSIRLTVAYKNISGLYDCIFAVLVEENIDIDDMNNKEKDGYAYAIIDICQDISNEVLSKLSAVEGVLKIRVICG